MQSKNKKPPTVLEGQYLAIVKRLPCSVCDATGPSDVHEPDQGQWWLSVALCQDCHTNPLLGWHGEKRAWAIRKMGMDDAQAVTIRRVFTKVLTGKDAP